MPLTEKIHAITEDTVEPWRERRERRRAHARENRSYIQFVDHGGNFLPSGHVDFVPELPPGLYNPIITREGIMFNRMHPRTETLLRFPDTATDEVIKDIETFWTREDYFAMCDLPYKRGILMYGPPGSGKSCAIQVLSRKLIKQGGIVLIFEDPEVFGAALNALREVQPDIPIVALMEDIDSIFRQCCETTILNLLDGITSVHKVVFLATTNYPERLGPRVTNRPSRFDRRYYIGHPNAVGRRMYFDHLFTQAAELKPLHDVEQWVKDTANLSIAHMKELFVSTVIMGNPYEKSLQKLTEMQNHISSDNMPDYEESNALSIGEFRVVDQNGEGTTVQMQIPHGMVDDLSNAYQRILDDAEKTTARDMSAKMAVPASPFDSTLSQVFDTMKDAVHSSGSPTIQEIGRRLFMKEQLDEAPIAALKASRSTSLEKQFARAKKP